MRMRKISIIRPKSAYGMALKYTAILDDKQKVGVLKNNSQIDLELDENEHKILFKVAGLLGIGNGKMSNTLMVPAGILYISGRNGRKCRNHVPVY